MNNVIANMNAIALYIFVCSIFNPVVKNGYNKQYNITKNTNIDAVL